MDNLKVIIILSCSFFIIFFVGWLIYLVLKIRQLKGEAVQLPSASKKQ
jgi:hypothetical protein